MVITYHNFWRESGLRELLPAISHVLGLIVWSIGAAAQDNMHVGVSLSELREYSVTQNSTLRVHLRLDDGTESTLSD